MNTEKSEGISQYLNYLPALLHEDEFLGRFLLAFEAILSRVPQSQGADTANSQGIKGKTPIIQPNNDNITGLEEVIDQIHLYFNPSETPKEFLPWLASWVALSLRDDLSPETNDSNNKDSIKREFISQIVPLYRLRGTKAGLEQMLKIFLGSPNEYVKIYEFDSPAHYFQVELELASQNLQDYRRKEKIAKAIIDQEKPAHTFYALQIQMPTMRIVSETLAQEEGLNPPQDYLLRIGNKEGHNNNTILGTKTAKAINSNR
ncbi:phage tail protein [Coleofasciculus sp.]|uniref:phage tail protein n=1 Tax=Coleofasciculus sp. TaxID=3100458 RepID=UPI003A243156